MSANELVEPLDPASAKGVETAARLSQVLADVEDEIRAEKAQAAATTPARSTSP